MPGAACALACDLGVPQWNCYYCPNHKDHPRSYLPDEPGCMRCCMLYAACCMLNTARCALECNCFAYHLMQGGAVWLRCRASAHGASHFVAGISDWRRCCNLLPQLMGHPVDKLEVLVLGGTWESYPESYRREFVRDLFWASNVFFDKVARTWESCGAQGSGLGAQGWHGWVVQARCLLLMDRCRSPNAVSSRLRKSKP